MHVDTINKFKQLRNLFSSPGISYLMEGHNALSATIVERSGFKGIWASGLTIAAAMGLRDENEASWTQVLEILELMSDATTIPILADCDTGYGNFNNVRRLIKKLCQRKIAGACIEDKMFPKMNSFANEHQRLLDIPTFCGKIKAAKDAQLEPDFTLVARVEALIAEHPMEEAVERAVRYYESGADAILIHSKKENADEIFTFKTLCPKEIPLVIVPTTYYHTPSSKFEEAGIKMVIWPNLNLRASIKAMYAICAVIQKEKSLEKANEMAAPFNEIFSLTNQSELDIARKKYA